ncbi:MAG: diacylglycerol kinase family lipid kinase [Actinomycetota bacterium]|nr:diacylglycerol kinase family lipid kinase [Actinomycetota bacterium]
MASHLGKTLLIANPAAKSGQGAFAVSEAVRLLAPPIGVDSFEATLTCGPLHAQSLAAEAGGFDTVIVLGGDGTIHEVANGLMDLPEETRPALGIIPVGSGNDYARTLRMSTRVDRACEQLLDTTPRPTDLGQVNGRWFVETLSFGVDAAIALDTISRRKGNGHSGTRLYVESAFEQLVHHLEERSYETVFEDSVAVRDSMLTFAVQVGPTYGGGFMICPEARIDDGLLDVCIAHPPLPLPRALLTFGKVRFGKHAELEQMEFHRVRRLHVEFDEMPPAQVDGEPIEATSFDISSVHHALQVLIPA